MTWKQPCPLGPRAHSGRGRFGGPDKQCGRDVAPPGRIPATAAPETGRIVTSGDEILLVTAFTRTDDQLALMVERLGPTLANIVTRLGSR